MKAELTEKQRLFCGKIILKDGQRIDLDLAFKSLKKKAFDVSYNFENPPFRITVKPEPLVSIFVFSNGSFQVFEGVRKGKRLNYVNFLKKHFKGFVR